MGRTGALAPEASGSDILRLAPLHFAVGVTGWSRHLCLRLEMGRTRALAPEVSHLSVLPDRQPSDRDSRDALSLCHPDRKPNDPERSRRGCEAEWRDPDIMSRAMPHQGVLPRHSALLRFSKFWQ